MAIEITCSCGTVLEVDDEDVGSAMKCPDCGAKLKVPAEMPRAKRRARPEGDEEDEDRPRQRKPATTSGKAIAGLILGVLSFCLPVLLSIPGIILGLMALGDIRRGKGRVAGGGLAIAALVISGATMLVGAPVLIFMLIPAVSRVRDAAANAQNSNNLRQLALAMHNYHDQRNQLPSPAICDATGKPLLSWRVAILPYIEQQVLYQQFKLNEPWDSPNNKALLSRMPRTFLSADSPPGTTTTPYQVFVGKGAAFDDQKAIVKIPQSFTDGTSNTILIAEAENMVEWTKPEDLRFDPNGPLPRLGRLGQARFLIATADAGHRLLRKDIKESTLRALITRAGGDIPGPDAIDR